MRNLGAKSSKNWMNTINLIVPMIQPIYLTGFDGTDEVGMN